MTDVPTPEQMRASAEWFDGFAKVCTFIRNPEDAERMRMSAAVLRAMADLIEGTRDESGKPQGSTTLINCEIARHLRDAGGAE